MTGITVTGLIIYQAVAGALLNLMMTDGIISGSGWPERQILDIYVNLPFRKLDRR